MFNKCLLIWPLFLKWVMSGIYLTFYRDCTALKHRAILLVKRYYKRETVIHGEKRMTSSLLSIHRVNTVITHCLHRTTGGLALMVFWCVINLTNFMAGGLVLGEKILLFRSTETDPDTDCLFTKHTYSSVTFALHGFLFKVLPATKHTLPPIWALVNILANKTYKFNCKTEPYKYSWEPQNWGNFPRWDTKPHISQPRDTVWNSVEEGSSRRGSQSHVMYSRLST